MSFSRRFRMPAIARTCLTAAVIVTIPGAVRAQGAPATADDDAVCYRFAFGAWSPALDKVAAGHDPDARGGPGAPNGRDWAVSDLGPGVTLMLFPAWWPAGVSVRLPGPPPAVGDTATGTATALVADGRRRPPTAPIRVLGVACGAPVGGKSPAPR